MERERFDTLVRLLATTPSRRQAVGALLGAALAGRAAATGAKSCGPCRKRKRGRCRRKRPDGTPCGAFGRCRNGRCVEPFCLGKNTCTNQSTPTCQASGNDCFCFVTADTGEPFCGQAGNAVANCAVCAAIGAACINGTGPGCQGGLACSAPCPDPR